MTDLRYPIGKLTIPDTISDTHLKEGINAIRTAPERLAKAIEGLDDAQLDTPYRPDGWTVRQVVHHVPDSHMNSYIRFHWTLSEDNPLIKAYDERSWASMEYSQSMPVDISLNLLSATHARLVLLLESLTEADLARTFRHPEDGETYTLKKTILTYAWHGNHHIAHITALRERMGW